MIGPYHFVRALFVLLLMSTLFAVLYEMEDKF